ncbi:hypothetical protein OH773_22220 (plasmid) [Buttiauxella sp. WJP83]|uniref:hypothetical protein n=1 Tax=Buttiauxella sp. WJP83 TaxID=2986951 RepID=UPI0022DCE5F5|nr:hypothetical protein [Buttiauxella sp. WJP83]WBM72962.1 hypothetical protein OH773_22220 [Buttiauxella sp. WJP83]
MIEELTLSEELDRKTIEALIRIADEQSRSLMTEREARLAVRAVFESVQGLVGESVGEAINAAMSQFNGGTKRPLFPIHLKLAGGAVLYVSVCLESNQINVLNATTGEWRDPVVCESGEEALKKAAQFVRSALLKGAKKL